MTPSPQPEPDDLFTGRGRRLGNLRRVRETPPPRPGVLTHTGRAIARAARWTAGPFLDWAVDTARRLANLVLQVAGLGFISWAAWQVHLVAGAVAIGASFLIVQALHQTGRVNLAYQDLIAMLDAARRGASNEQILNPPRPSPPKDNTT